MNTKLQAEQPQGIEKEQDKEKEKESEPKAKARSSHVVVGESEATAVKACVLLGLFTSAWVR